MMESLFKSIVNAVVILSIFITSMPLQAMDNREEDKRTPCIRKISSRTKQAKKAPIDFIKHNKEAVAAKPALEKKPRKNESITYSQQVGKRNTPRPTTPTISSNVTKTAGAFSISMETPPTHVQPIHCKNSQKINVASDSPVVARKSTFLKKNNGEEKKSIVPDYHQTTMSKSNSSLRDNLKKVEKNPSHLSREKPKPTKFKALSNISKKAEAFSVLTTSQSAKTRIIRNKGPQEIRDIPISQNQVTPRKTISRQKVSPEEKKDQADDENKRKKEQDRIENALKLKEEYGKQKKEQFRIAWKERMETLESNLQESKKIEEERRLKGEERKRLEKERMLKAIQANRRLRKKAEAFAVLTVISIPKEDPNKHSRKLREEEEEHTERVLKQKEEEHKRSVALKEQNRIEHELKQKEEKESKRFEEERRLKEEQEHKKLEKERKLKAVKANRPHPRVWPDERKLDLHPEDLPKKEILSPLKRIFSAKAFQRILTPLEEKKPSIVTSQVVQVDYNPDKPITMLPAEVMHMILDLDAPTPLVVRQVCKFWRTLSTDWREQDIKQSVLLLMGWQPGDESEKLLKAFTFNPHHLLVAIQSLGSMMPLCLKDNKFKWKNFLKSQKEENSIPEIADKFIVVLKNFSYLHQILCRIFLNHIDILDIHSTSFAAYIVYQIPKIRSMLEEIRKRLQKDLGFKPTKFPKLTKDFKNHTRLKQYLLALKLLAMTGDKEATLQQRQLYSPIKSFLSPKVKKNGKEVTHLNNQPLWGVYVIGNLLLDEQWETLFNYNSYCEDIDTSVLKAFSKYYSILNSYYAVLVRMPQYLEYLLGFYYKRGDEEGLLTTLASLNNRDLNLVIGSQFEENSPIKRFITSGRISLAKLIHEEVNSRINNDSSVSEFEHYYLQSLLEAFDEKEDKKSILKIITSLATSFLRRLISQPIMGRSVIEHYIFYDRLPLAILIHEEANKRFKYDPDKFEVARYYLQYLLTSLKRKWDQTNIYKILQSLETSYLKRFLIPSKQESVSPLESYMDNDQYNLAMLVLEEANKRFESDPFLLRTELTLAKRIFATHDNSQFPGAEKYLQRVLEQTQKISPSDFKGNSSFHEDENLSRDENETYPPSPRQPIEATLPLSEEEISLAFSMRIALRIYQGRFEEAIDDLQAAGDSLHNEVILTALQSQLQNPALPAGLIRRIGINSLSRIFKFTSSLEEEVNQNTANFDAILRGIYEHDHLFQAASKRGLLSPELLKSFWMHLFIIRPSAAKFFMFHIITNFLYFAYTFIGDEASYFRTLEEMHNLFSPYDLYANLELAQDYSIYRRYTSALAILDSINKQIAESPLRFKIWLESAQCILGLQDEKRFAEADEYLKKICQHVPDKVKIKDAIAKKKFKKELSSYHSAQWTVHSFNNFGYLPIISYADYIDDEATQNSAIYLQAILNIYCGNFEKAYLTLQINLEEEIDDILFQALQSQLQNPLLPNKLLSLTASSVSEMFIDMLKVKRKRKFENNKIEKKFMLDLINDYRELFATLSKYNPSINSAIHELVTLCSLESSPVSSFEEPETSNDKDTYGKEKGNQAK